MRALLVLVASASLVGAQDGTPCPQISVDTAVEAGMRLLTFAMNDGAWADMAHDKDLDPYEPNEKIDFSIPCKYFGTPLCGAQASSCKKSKVQMTLRDILGLAGLHIDGLQATGVAASDGTCPFKAEHSIPSANINCGFSGAGNGAVSIPEGANIHLDIDDMELKVQCENSLVGQTWWETPLKSSRVSCDMGPGAAATAKMSYCGATCNKSLLSTSFTHASFSDFSFSHYDKALKCTAAGISDMVSDEVMRFIETAVVGFVNKPIQDVLNKVLGKELKDGFPTKCKAPEDRE